MHTYDLRSLLNLDDRVVYFPVRHHSPTAARLVRELTLRLRPDAILIEGPADFNERIEELYLPHRPPLAVYSYSRLPTGQRRGAYYPLCEHSPEWQALLAAREVGAMVRFIDLHWADIAREGEPDNRYSDAEFRRSDYIASLCKRLGVEDFNTLWDTLFELDADLSVETYLERAHHLCGSMRLLEGAGSITDRRREAFMASMIRQALEDHRGRILVVTGGYHSVALQGRLTGRAPEGMAEPADCQPLPPIDGEERGIALTPYSFARLDSLTGYEAGMPNPGFYQQVWRDRKKRRRDTHHTLLKRVAERLRENKQPISSADLIAVETTASGLAALRGHAQVWRTDLVDGIIGSLIKEEMVRGRRHPLLDAVHEVLRGGERGMLAEGAMLPPLVVDIRAQLEANDLHARSQPRDVDVDLDMANDRQRSRILHRLRLLDGSGYERTDGTDLRVRDDLSKIWERWHIAWNPDFDARCIESARYGPSLAEAATARLSEAASAIERDAGKAALLLLDAALAGLTDLTGSLLDRLKELIRTDGDFFSVTGALGHLLYLYRYDTVLETAGSGEFGSLLTETYQRGLWLLESLGQVTGQDTQLLNGLGSLRETFERCSDSLKLDRAELMQVLTRIGADRGQRPLVRGGVIGALWSLGAADGEQVQTALREFADPNHLGDFLTGLFALAREQVQRQRDLALGINDLLSRYNDDDFLTALPALRLAFTYFTPREKHHLALTLREALGLAKTPEMAALTVDTATAARALAFEARLFESLEKYGVRGGRHESA
jgi:hypothetical protein